MLKNMKIKTSRLMGFGITIATAVTIIAVILVMLNVQRSSYQNIIDGVITTNDTVTVCRP